MTCAGSGGSGGGCEGRDVCGEAASDGGGRGAPSVQDRQAAGARLPLRHAGLPGVRARRPWVDGYRDRSPACALTAMFEYHGGRSDVLTVMSERLAGLIGTIRNYKDRLETSLDYRQCISIRKVLVRVLHQRWHRLYAEIEAEELETG